MTRKLLQFGNRTLLRVLPRGGRVRYHFLRHHGYVPRLARPATLSEHLTARKLRPPSALATLTADKFAVREYVAERVGDACLTRLHGVYDDADKIEFGGLASFAAKATHGSGWNAIVPDAATADLAAVQERCRGWLARNYATEFDDCWYDAIPPRIVVEEFLSVGGQSPADYKFFVFRGEPVVVQVDADRFTRHTRNLYDTTWNRLACTLRFPAGDETPRPANLDAMLAMAAKLGADFDFVRVDLYDVGDRVVFGELTHCPGSGFERFSDPSVDRWLGDLLNRN